MKNSKTGIRHLAAAFGYSIHGLRYALQESAFRQELLLGLLHIVACCLAGLSVERNVLLSVLYVAVLVVELINTSIESVVDLVSPGYHELAKRAKDLASSAILLALVAYFGAWITLISF